MRFPSSCIRATGISLTPDKFRGKTLVCEDNMQEGASLNLFIPTSNSSNEIEQYFSPSLSSGLHWPPQMQEVCSPLNIFAFPLPRSSSPQALLWSIPSFPSNLFTDVMFTEAFPEPTTKSCNFLPTHSYLRPWSIGPHSPHVF